MKVSIVTVCFNNSKTIKDTIDSVLNQSYNDIEYIIVDGGSTDGTIDIISSYGSKVSRFISESDSGIYNAMNKGIKMAIGEVVGTLNADDFFFDNSVISKVVDEFSNNDIDALYGDIQFVKPENIEKVVRYYSSKRFNIKRFKYGFMPAHPSFYVKRKWFAKLGYYKEDYQIGADFELLIRFLMSKKLKYKYVETVFVTMRTGGASNRNLKSRIRLNDEIIRACRENSIHTNYFFVYSKYLVKVFELISFKG